MITGRPTLYDPIYCEKIIEIMAEGYSIGGAAGKIGVDRATVYRWEQKHDEFRDAINIGRAMSQAYWETMLINSAKSGSSASAAIFGLKNRGRDHWQDRQVHVGDKGSDAIQHDVSVSAADEVRRELERMGSPK